MASASNSRKSFQRVSRFANATLGELSRHVELFEDNVAKKFRGLDAAVVVVAEEVLTDDRIFGYLNFSIGAGSVADGLLYTTPLVTGLSNGVFVVSRAICWLTDRLGATDTGNVNVRIGTSLGDNTIMTDQNVVAATTTGVIGGLSIASRGSSLLVANGYEYQIPGDTQIWVRAATTGTITKGTVLVELFGYFFPTPANG